MKVYKDNQGKYFELLYTQNEKSNAAPVESTMWFHPLEIYNINKIKKGLQRIKGVWARPLAENLVARYLTLHTGPVVEKVDIKTNEKVKQAATSEKEEIINDVEH